MEKQPPPPDGLDTLVFESAFVLFRHKWKIILFALAGVVAAVYVWVSTPTVYQSEARLLVRYVAETTEPSVDGGKVTDPDLYGANIINSEIAILTSVELLGKVVDTVGPEKLLKDGADNVTRDAAVLSLSENLVTVVPKQSSVINVYCSCRDPGTAQSALGELIRLYLEKHVHVHRSGLDYDFLSQQTDRVAARLAETEAELRAAKAEAGVTDLDESRSAVVSRTTLARDEIQKTEAELAAALARLVSMVRPLPGAVGTNAVSEAVSPSTTYSEGRARRNTLYTRLARLREKEASLLLTYTENSLPVKNIRQEIDKAEAEWQSLPPSMDMALATDSGGSTGSASSPDLMSADSLLVQRANVAALEERLKVVKRHLAQAEKEASRIEQSEDRIQSLMRRREIDEANFLYFSKCLEQARVNDALDSGKVSNISVVQGASYPLEGMRRNLMRNAGLAVVLGFAAGVGLAFAVEKGFNARYFARPSELRDALGLPVLATIPQMANRKSVKLGESALPPPDVRSPHVARPSLSPVSDGFGAYCEALQQRVTGIPALPSEKTPLLGVVGSSRGAGVSTIVSGIAVSLAKSENVRVLVVSSSLDQAVEVALNSQGQVTVLDRDSYVSGGENSETRLPQISSPVRRFREFVAHVRQGDYDFVLVDLSAVGETGPTGAIASLLDGVIMVVQAEKDQRATVRLALEHLGQSGARVIGTVFNRRRFHGPKWLTDGV